MDRDEESGSFNRRDFPENGGGRRRQS